jgi:hypothetical protein
MHHESFHNLVSGVLVSIGWLLTLVLGLGVEPHTVFGICDEHVELIDVIKRGVNVIDECMELQIVPKKGMVLH